MPFDIRQLRYAIAAADHGSFYRASRVLDVEQSTLSRAILKLERVIGGRIFNRSQGGVSMTLAGAQFIRCLLYTSPSPRDLSTSRMPSSA